MSVVLAVTLFAIAKSFFFIYLKILFIGGNKMFIEENERKFNKNCKFNFIAFISFDLFIEFGLGHIPKKIKLIF